MQTKSDRGVILCLQLLKTLWFSQIRGDGVHNFGGGGQHFLGAGSNCSLQEKPIIPDGPGTPAIISLIRACIKLSVFCSVESTFNIAVADISI